VTVEAFWRRIGHDSIRDRSLSELRALVPHFLEKGFEEEQIRGTLVGVEDTDALIGALLKMGARQGPAAPAARRFSDGPSDWNEDWMIGTFDLDAVQQIADLFAGADLDAWTSQYGDELAGEARSLGYSGDQLESILSTFLSDAREVGSLFIAAAANREYVIFRVVV
jgi:hypothetical protein